MPMYMCISVYLCVCIYLYRCLFMVLFTSIYIHIHVYTHRSTVQGASTSISNQLSDQLWRCSCQGKLFACQDSQVAQYIPKSWNTDVGLHVLICLLSLDWGWTTAIFQLLASALLGCSWDYSMGQLWGLEIAPTIWAYHGDLPSQLSIQVAHWYRILNQGSEL